MNRMKRSALCAALLAMVSACDQGAETNEQATAPENAQAASNEMQMMNDPANPYAAVEMQMHETMMAAQGANISDTWARKMIAHHRGAVAMSEVLLAQEPNSRFAQMARATVATQTAEIQELETMLQNRETSALSQQPPASARPAPPAAPASTPEPRTTAQPAAKAKAETPPPPEAVDPHAGHDMSNMSDDR